MKSYLPYSDKSTYIQATATLQFCPVKQTGQQFTFSCLKVGALSHRLLFMSPNKTQMMEKSFPCFTFRCREHLLFLNNMAWSGWHSCHNI